VCKKRARPLARAGSEDLGDCVSYLRIDASLSFVRS
jgi:hypothetical protein